MLRSRRRIFFALLSIIICVLGWSYSTHLWFCYAKYVGRLADVEAIPCLEMPTEKTGSDWLKHNADDVTLTLPPGFARTQETRSPVFEDGELIVAVLIDS